MSGNYEVRRLVRRYERAFENGREELYKELELHIGVLEIAIATVEQRIDELAEQIEHWGDSIAYAYITGEQIGKLLIIHRVCMFVLMKYSEYMYGRCVNEQNELFEYNKKFEEFVKKLDTMKAC